MEEVGLVLQCRVLLLTSILALFATNLNLIVYFRMRLFESRVYFGLYSGEDQYTAGPAVPEVRETDQSTSSCGGYA